MSIGNLLNLMRDKDTKMASKCHERVYATAEPSLRELRERSWIIQVAKDVWRLIVERFGYLPCPERACSSTLVGFLRERACCSLCTRSELAFEFFPRGQSSVDLISGWAAIELIHCLWNRFCLSK
jgi:hypothetical protein